MSSDGDQFYSDDEEVVNNTSSGRSSKSSRRSSRNSNAAGVVIDETETEEEYEQSGESEESEKSEISVESEKGGESGESEESGDSDDDSVRVPTKNTKRKLRPLGIPSDSEDEDEELEQRALSPSTRMSITGVRPQDLSDGDSEIDYSDEGQEVPQAVGGAKLVPRYTTHFAENIQEALHSTLGGADLEPPEDSSGSDVLIISNKETAIEISSSEEEVSNNKENLSVNPFPRSSSSYSPRSSAGAPVVKTTKNLSQPTIMAALKQGNLSGSPLGSRVKSEDQRVVSQEVYDEEMRKLAEKRAQLSDAEKLFEKVAHKLPDKGSQIMKRIDVLRKEVENNAQIASRLKVEPSKMPAIKAAKPMFNPPRAPSIDTPDWDELSAAVNQIKPVYTGTQGMATFNNQKALTLESLKDLHGSLKDCPGPEVLAEDPKGLKVPLMDHQKHALAWMSWRERQLPRGGILADDMGLGKTLTMISSVLACKNLQERKSGEDQSSGSDSEDDKNKKRKSTGGWNSKGRKDSHKGGTLVVCPASLLRQWESEVESKVSRHKLTVCVHHGNNRETKGKHLRTYDIVVTTYQIVAREHKNLSAVFGVKWRRVILDEAHVVRNHKSQSSMAVSDLRAKYRWALTGTPIQNKELDVYALLKFLRCSPFDDLNTWKKWIDNKSAGGQNRLNLLMKSLMLRRTKAQLQMDGKLKSLPNKEMRLMEISLGTEEMNVYQTVMTYSRTLFAQFLHQRAEKDTDFNYRNDANKPTYNQIKDPNGAYYKMHEKFSKMAGSKREVKSHDILVLLLRLRQICCHPGLIDAMLDGEEAQNMEGHSSDSDSPEIDLLAQLNKLAITDTSTESRPFGAGGGDGGDDGHPLGADEARIAKASKNLLKRTNPVFNLSRPSSKMIKVIEILKKTILSSSDDKAIVVSQWTSVLDILRDHLDRDSVPTLSLNGSIPVKNRQDIVNQFNDPNNQKRVLLLSLTAGGVGLNLIGANHLLLLDLHWNPQLEAQAQDRIYRVGQKKDVIIYKFMCVDTVEQRIKALQDKKLELANGVLTGSTVSSKLTIDDLKGLFGM
ncbi:transcription termination factor 2 isoform X3 [Drosophila ficusphila]|uniref:transcription termination factor 2 isoform X2 n=1 Tax=Drosophila ficusphila TaxID=30025 RepID=UPI0007E81E00|nr:transcription termination factor 2 isoform X2 [Drosophila ficusphila]XP_017057057.1 transcription termination factor 2 isoform X3 [Drosophila ficusphila]